MGLLGLVALCPVSPARADSEGTGRRLKASGSDDALRGEIQASIDRGVKFLVSRQQPDGSFVERARDLKGEPSWLLPVPGVTVLAVLSLRHAGTPTSAPALRNGLAYLFERDPAVARGMERDVYQAGIALMLLADTPGHEVVARRFAGALSGALDAESDWWGYRTPGGDGVDPCSTPTAFRDSIPNLSASQFAALGLRAARKMRIAVPTQVWIRHATALCDSQKKNGSWQYGRGGITAEKRKPGTVNLDDEFGCVTGTYMGLANLLLAQEALRTASRAPAGLETRVAAAIVRARKALARHVPRNLSDPRISIHPEEEESKRRVSGMHLAPRHHPASPGVGAYSTLFALEKACLFADIEDFEVPKSPSARGERKSKPGTSESGGRLSWYATGARWLLSVQRRDGGWSPNAGDPAGDEASEVDTAFALLFLARSPSVFHPTLPADVDANPLAVPQPGDPPKEK